MYLSTWFIFTENLEQNSEYGIVFQPGKHSCIETQAKKDTDETGLVCSD